MSVDYNKEITTQEDLGYQDYFTTDLILQQKILKQLKLMNDKLDQLILK